MNAESKKLNIAIIDYGLGNLFSVNQALNFYGANAYITDQKEDIQKADAVVLPGVGAFGQAMQNLNKKDLVGVIKDSISENKPFLGICLGLQLLFEESEEFGSSKGLGLIPGYIKKFPYEIGQKKVTVPQIAWNKIYPSKALNNGQSWAGTVMDGIEINSYVYFVHSFYAVPGNPQDALIDTSYEGLNYCSGVAKKNIFALQFHPEKSSQVGAQIFKNWLARSSSIAKGK